MEHLPLQLFKMEQKNKSISLAVECVTMSQACVSALLVLLARMVKEILDRDVIAEQRTHMPTMRDKYSCFNE